MKGSENAAWITWVAWALRSGGEVRWPRQKSPRWSAGGRACRSHGRRHPQKVPDQDVAPDRRSPPSCLRGREMKAAPRAWRLPGPMALAYWASASEATPSFGRP